MPGKLITIQPGGSEETVILQYRPNLDEIRKHLNNGWAEPIRVRYEGKFREAWMDEEGFLKQLPQNNVAQKLIADAYTMKPEEIVRVVGPLVIWIPTPKEKKDE